MKSLTKTKNRNPQHINICKISRKKVKIIFKNINSKGIKKDLQGIIPRGYYIVLQHQSTFAQSLSFSYRANPCCYMDHIHFLDFPQTHHNRNYFDLLRNWPTAFITPTITSIALSTKFKSVSFSNGRSTLSSAAS